VAINLVSFIQIPRWRICDVLLNKVSLRDPVPSIPVESEEALDTVVDTVAANVVEIDGVDVTDEELSVGFAELVCIDTEVVGVVDRVPSSSLVVVTPVTVGTGSSLGSNPAAARSNKRRLFALLLQQHANT